MSQIFSSYTLGQLWDSSHLFDLSHTYLKHGTVMGSNICEVSDLFHIVFEFSLTLLCLQTRQSLFWT